MSESVFDPPILGEPAPVELANTAYGVPPECWDFLGSVPAAQRWFDAMGLDVPLDSHGVQRLVRLRDVIRAVLDGLVGPDAPIHPIPPGDSALSRAVEQLVEAANDGAPRRVATWTDAGLEVSFVRNGTALDRALGHLADQTLALITGSDRERLRVCDAPDCTMLFVKQHHRRRWCHPTCGGRMRQAAYMRRQAQQP